MKQQLIKIMIFAIAALLIGLPIVYASACNCGHIAMPCMHDASGVFKAWETSCGHEKPAEKEPRDCSQLVPCEFMQENSKFAVLVRAIHSDFESVKCQLIMIINRGPDDFDHTGLQQETTCLSFFQNIFFPPKLYLTNESFIC